MPPRHARRLPRRLLALLCCTGTAFALGTTPALADRPAMRVEAYITPGSVVVNDLTGMAIDETGELLVAEEGNLVSWDEGLSASIVRIEDRADHTPLVTVPPDDTAPRDIAVTSDGDVYFSTREAAVHVVDDGEAEELVPPEGYVGSPPVLAAGPDALYVARSSEISRVDVTSPDDAEPLVDLDSPVRGMHMTEDTLYVAADDDVLAIEDPEGGDVEPESLTTEHLEEGAALDVTVDSGLVHAVGTAGLIRFDDAGPRILPDISGTMIETTWKGLVVAQESSQLLLVRGLTEEDDALNWVSPRDATDTHRLYGEERESGDLYTIRDSPTDALDLAPGSGGMDLPVDVYRDGLPLTLDFALAGEGPSDVYRTEDGTAWFLDGDHLLTFREDTDPVQVAQVDPVVFGEDLSSSVGEDTGEELRYIAPGDGYLFLASVSDLYVLGDFGLRRLSKPGDFDTVRGIAARGDTAHVLEGSGGGDVRVVTVNTRGETETTFTTEGMDDPPVPDGLAVDADRTYYMSDGDQILRVRDDDVDVIAGAADEQEVEDSDAATETALASARTPVLDGAGNLLFRSDDGVHALVDAADAPVHPDNEPWRVPLTIGSVTVVALAVAGGVLLWLRKRIATAPESGGD